MSELLKISGLRGGYKEGDGFEILSGVNMTVNEGEVVGIIGLNGSGKSTLGKAVMNMIPIRKGEILFHGKSIMGLPTHEIVRKGISIMQQGGQVFPNLSVWENLELASKSGSRAYREKLMKIFPLLQVPKRKLQNQMGDKLSGGEKHQLALAMTLATEPKLVILDEPSAGLSPKSVETMFAILDSVKVDLGVSIILIEHNVFKASAFANRVYRLKDGRADQLVYKSLQYIDELLFNP